LLCTLLTTFMVSLIPLASLSAIPLSFASLLAIPLSSDSHIKNRSHWQVTVPCYLPAFPCWNTAWESYNKDHTLILDPKKLPLWSHVGAVPKILYSYCIRWWLNPAEGPESTNQIDWSGGDLDPFHGFIFVYILPRPHPRVSFFRVGNSTYASAWTVVQIFFFKLESNWSVLYCTTVWLYYTIRTNVVRSHTDVCTAVQSPAIPKIYSVSVTVTPPWVHGFFSITLFI
jgi:hypothetical protein